MSGRPAARRSLPAGRQGRRVRPVRRASAGLSRVRAGAALVALAAAAAIYGVASSSAFQYATLRVLGAHYTDVTAVEASLAAIRGENLFRIETSPLESRIGELTTVERARVEVELPDTLAVTLEERDADPRLAGRRSALPRRPRRCAVRRRSARSRRRRPPRCRSSTTSAPASVGLGVGGILDPVDLDAATRLASLRPADVGSAAEGLALSLTDENGFLVRSRPAGWTAVFGFYTPSLRTPALIPGQVRLLRSLLFGRESEVARVILASDTNGTFIPRPTPTPKASAKPSPAP